MIPIAIYDFYMECLTIATAGAEGQDSEDTYDECLRIAKHLQKLLERIVRKHLSDGQTAAEKKKVLIDVLTLALSIAKGETKI